MEIIQHQGCGKQLRTDRHADGQPHGTQQAVLDVDDAGQQRMHRKKAEYGRIGQLEADIENKERIKKQDEAGRGQERIEIAIRPVAPARKSTKEIISPERKIEGAMPVNST